MLSSSDLGSAGRSHPSPPPMSPRLADVPPPLQPRAASPKNSFDREPLLIPQLFGNGKPWYRRRAVLVKLTLALVFVTMFAAVVQRLTVTRILTKFAKIVGG
jgi:hypothetical protein